MDRTHPTHARCFTGRKPHRINISAVTQTESMFCRSHARQNRIFSHNPNLGCILSSTPMQSVSCPALASQSHDSKPLTPKLFSIYILPVTATGQSTYGPISPRGGWQGEGANERRNKCEVTRSLHQPGRLPNVRPCGMMDAVKNQSFSLRSDDNPVQQAPYSVRYARLDRRRSWRRKLPRLPAALEGRPPVNPGRPSHPQQSARD